MMKDMSKRILMQTCHLILSCQGTKSRLVEAKALTTWVELDFNQKFGPTLLLWYFNTSKNTTKFRQKSVLQIQRLCKRQYNQSTTIFVNSAITRNHWIWREDPINITFNTIKRRREPYDLLDNNNYWNMNWDIEKSIDDSKILLRCLKC